MNNQSDLYHAYPAKFNGLIALISRYNLTWLIIKNVEVEGIKTDVIDILKNVEVEGIKTDVIDRYDWLLLCVNTDVFFT